MNVFSCILSGIYVSSVSILYFSLDWESDIWLSFCQLKVRNVSISQILITFESRLMFGGSQLKISSLSCAAIRITIVGTVNSQWISCVLPIKAFTYFQDSIHNKGIWPVQISEDNLCLSNACDMRLSQTNNLKLFHCRF